MGAPSPDKQITDLSKERQNEAQRASKDAVLKRLGQRTLGAVQNTNASNSDILDIGLSRSKQEKKDELEQKKKESVQSNIETKGRNKDEINNIRDEKKKESRDKVREVNERIRDNITTKETDIKENKKELKDKKSDSDRKLSDAESNVSLFYDVNQAKASGALKPDGSIDFTIVKGFPIGGVAITPARQNAADAALSTWNAQSKENKDLENRLSASTSTVIEIHNEVNSELDRFVEDLYSEDKTIGEIKGYLDDEIIRLALMEMKREGGKFKKKDFILQ